MNSHRVHLISGGTGGTAAHVMRACLAQFESAVVDIQTHAPVRTNDEIRRIVELASNENAIICHTLVEPELRQLLSKLVLHENIPCVDILGPCVSVVSECLSQAAHGKPGLLYELNKEQYDRMEAVDFTMAHDDGNRLWDIDQAELILTGVSRVSKSVTCFYLASRGIRAANVPLVAGQEPPQELLKLDPKLVFGLTMNASRLSSIRQTRLNRITTRDVPDYATVRELNREILFAERLFSERGWHRVDVSYMATEEVASHIMDTLQSQII